MGKEDHFVNLYECGSFRKIEKAIELILKTSSLPSKKSSTILLKPNFNSDMIGLTGNTTDLRIVATVIRFLKRTGYRNITIGDGTSSGFLNAGINVMARLGVHQLARKFETNVVDFNNLDSNNVNVNIGKENVKIADICINNDFFINLPKLKTHSEASLSACSKNLIGCVVGKDKQKIHKNLPENIINLVTVLEPDLNIVDALIAMDGTGPSRGNPKKMNHIIVGDHALTTDVICSKLIGLEESKVPYLEIARKKGITQILIDEINESLSHLDYTFEKPTPSLLFRIINNPRYRWIFSRIRYSFLSSLFSSNLVSRVLFGLGARQDFFNKNDAKITTFSLDMNRCIECGICDEYCPMKIHLPTDLETNKKCCRCLYCYFVCPTEAIRLNGNIGYLSYQIDEYRERIIKQVRL
jgi:uncharacterized protein (DUF362 family)/NAD-dependent dihydropyrimidine dehydrogenase PreA subunit